MPDEETPKPALTLHLTAEQLKTHTTFQEAFYICKPFLMDMYIGLMSQKAKELRENKSELGRQVIVINDLMEMLNKAGGDQPKGYTKVKRKELNSNQR